MGGEKKLSHLNADQNLLFYGLLNGAKKKGTCKIQIYRDSHIQLFKPIIEYD